MTRRLLFLLRAPMMSDRVEMFMLSEEQTWKVIEVKMNLWQIKRKTCSTSAVARNAARLILVLRPKTLEKLSMKDLNR